MPIELPAGLRKAESGGKFFCQAIRTWRALEQKELAGEFTLISSENGYRKTAIPAIDRPLRSCAVDVRAGGP